jgi:Ca2+-dependent lipid-binding protein
MRALDVKNVEKGALGFGRTDPYLEIAKEYSYPSIGSKHVQVVYRSEVIHNHLNPLWERSNVNLEVLCDGNLDMPLRVSIWDYSSSKRTMIGSFDTNVRGLMSSVATNGNADRSRSFEFYSGELRHQKTVGHLVVMEARFL